MPRNASGTYSLPAGNPVTSGTTIDASWANTTLNDIANELTNSLDRNGNGGMLAAFRFSDGSVSSPGMSWTNETTTGFYRGASGEMWASVQSTQVAQFTVNGITIPAGRTLTVVGNATVGGNLGVTGTLTAGTFNGNVNGTATGLSAVLGIDKGGTGQSTAAAARNALLPSQTGANGQFLTTDGAGNVSWANVSGASGGTVTNVSGTGNVNGITLSGSVSSSGSLTLGGTLANVSLTSQVTGVLPRVNGGTGLSTVPANGQLLIGNGSGYSLANIQAGSNITITNLSGGIQISAAGSTGVSSVSASLPLSSSGGTTPNITIATPIATNYGGTGIGSFTANKALYASNSSTLVSGNLPVAGGGTGAATAADARTNLSAAQSGTNTDITSVALNSGTVNGFSIGYLNIPQTTSTTLAASSVGKHHYVSAGVTVNTGVFSAGDAFMVVNSTSSAITITQGTSVTLRLGGTATTGNRTLAEYGVASILCVSAGVFIVSGSGVT